MVRLRCSAVVIGLLLMGTLGCDTFHNLQTHRLQRLNRGVDGMPPSQYFSVSDPIEEDTRVDQGQSIASNKTQVQQLSDWLQVRRQIHLHALQRVSVPCGEKPMAGRMKL